MPNPLLKSDLELPTAGPAAGGEVPEALDLAGAVDGLGARRTLMMFK
jgi:hypothetical protein